MEISSQFVPAVQHLGRAKKAESAPSAKRWLFAFVLGLLILFLFHFAIAERLIALAYNRQGPAWLNSLIKNPDGGPLSYYVTAGRVYFSRALLTYFVCFGVAAIWAFRRGALDCVRQFFCEPDSALNLAVFRIALFGTVFYMADARDVAAFASVPTALRVLPSEIGRAHV